ncbi:hypothetical protein TVAG_018960 [Trichomonas vaginalis G3]|uniref:Uncharacterized protein n=1 Tax=Trichomonas vaginalis (strain ATCC PRA-98 / G3) TaxID=412133 RepID=A2G496_TRIV3|nr:hypothetical protein TVAGG3_0215650 [Trichomonas vaginalis G3]EAX88024.1 hypothetical protein TVAG_018960 [Trichomonas vaginalis G3]KAI5551543.1 hypothetical protein TVAGG3_0215650 [Trichomonas vaginalis G3]|eukprot:XP_001300954.1 hypothetical protein [Trichomonas vaginalis G3]
MLIDKYHLPSKGKDNNELYSKIASKCSYSLYSAVLFTQQMSLAQLKLEEINFSISNRNIFEYYHCAQRLYEGMILYLDLTKFSKEEKQKCIYTFSDVSNETYKMVDQFLKRCMLTTSNIRAWRTFSIFHTEILNNCIIRLTTYISNIIRCVQSGNIIRKLFT